MDKRYKLNKWTENEIAVLLENRHLPNLDLSKLIGRSIKAIMHKKTQFGIQNKQRRYSKEEIENVIYLVENNFNLSQISKILKISHTSLRGLCDRLKIKQKRHGKTGTKIYETWKRMNGRCYNKNHPKYKDYGGRGIFVSEEWQSFESFYEWAIIDHKDYLEIDRIDNNGPYSKENCRWATRKQQCNNKRCSKILIVFNECKTLTEWSEDKRCVVGVSCLRSRICRGMDPEIAITTPLLRSTKIFSNKEIP